MAHVGEERALRLVRPVGNFLFAAQGVAFFGFQLHGKEIDADDGQQKEKETSRAQDPDIDTGNVARHRFPWDEAAKGTVRFGQIGAEQEKPTLSAFRVNRCREGSVETGADFSEPSLHRGIGEDEVLFARVLFVGNDGLPFARHQDKVEIGIVIGKAEMLLDQFVVIEPPEDATHVIPGENRHRDEESLPISEIHHILASDGRGETRKNMHREFCAEHIFAFDGEDACGAAVARRRVDRFQNIFAAVRICLHIFRRIMQDVQFPPELVFGEMRHIFRLTCDNLLHRRIQKMRDLVLHEDRADAQSDHKDEEFDGDLQNRGIRVVRFIFQGIPPLPQTNPCALSVQCPGALLRRRCANCPPCRGSAL